MISTDAIGARSVFATDLDGDGDTDVLSASFDDDKIAWYENKTPPPQPSCDDIRRFRAVCDHPAMPGMILGAVVLSSNIFDGKTITIEIDGVPQTVVINNGRARATAPGTPGPHSVAFTDPDCCGQMQVFRTVNCP